MSFDPKPPSRVDVKKSVSPSGEMAPRLSLAAVFTTVPSVLGSDQGSSTLFRTDEYMSDPALPVRLEWNSIYFFDRRLDPPPSEFGVVVGWRGVVK